MVEERIIRQTVGAAAFGRALDLVASGAVLSFARTDRKGTGERLVGSVQGTARSPYAVVVRVLGAGSSAGFSGTCTCPVHYDCKHAAALVIMAARADRRAATVDPVRAEPTPRAEWARALRPLLATNDSAAVDPPAAAPTVALQFDLTVGQPGAGRISLRPVLRGQSDRWIRTGISWTSLTYHQRTAAAAVALLEELYALSTRRDRYHYYSREEPVLLESFPSARVWDVLAQAAEVGLPLVSAGAAAGEVTLAREPARVTLDLADEGPDWRLRPIVTAGPEALEPGRSMLLGEPAHGVAWWDPDGPPSARGGGSLHLARLERALPVGLRSLVARGRDLAVPAGEQAEFLRDYYPVLRRQVTVTSADESVDLPAARPPRLVLHTAHSADHHVTVRWSWVYAIGEATREAALWPPAYLADQDRETDAEAKVLQDVGAFTDAMPVLSEDAPGGPRLAAQTELAGADALVDLATLVAGLAELANVEVRSSGHAVALRPASEPPLVKLDGAAEGRDWFDLAVSVSVDGEPVPFASLFTALALEQRYLVLPSGTYLSLDRPELQRLRELIEEARGLGERAEDGSVRVGRFQVDFWQELMALGVVSAQAAEWSDTVRLLAEATDLADVEPPRVPRRHDAPVPAGRVLLARVPLRPLARRRPRRRHGPGQDAAGDRAAVPGPRGRPDRTSVPRGRADERRR